MTEGNPFGHGLMDQRRLQDADVEQAMITVLLGIVGEQRAQDVPAGTMMLRRGEVVDRIWVMLDGQVRLYRETPNGEMDLHSRTVGPIIGLLALATGEPSSMNCKTVNDVSAVCLTLEELDELLSKHPVLSWHFTIVLLRSLARRHGRAVELRLEVDALNADLTAERDRLFQALEQLKAAEARIIENEKMATLGQLARGLAHELNNPVAAIGRSADFLIDDIQSLAGRLPGGELMKNTVRNAVCDAPLSTREERARRRELAGVLGDETLADRLLRMGVANHADYRTIIEDIEMSERDERIDTLESCHQLGRSLRSIRSCSSRIADLVRSLRSYSRTDNQGTEWVNVHVGIEETLMLFGHELRKIEVVRDFADLPDIDCRPGELNQVWTNLISNAIQAMEGEGVLRIETSSGAGSVRVAIIDSGQGISSENLKRIFEVNFTTRCGDTGYGLGIGLPITREIVVRHGGTIEVDSEPGRTCFVVTLSAKTGIKGDAA